MFARCSLAASLALALLASPAQARADEPTNPVEGRAYVYAAPGVVFIPLGDDDFTDLADVSYEWGLGGGGMFSPVDKLGIGVGLGLHHSPLNPDEDVTNFCGTFNCDARGNLLRILPELRVGGGIKRLFLYGLLAPGLVIATYRVEFDSGLIEDSEDTDAGFNLGLGAGAQFSVWRSLVVGGEFGGNLGFMGDPDDDDVTVGGAGDGYGAHGLNLRVLVGWYF